MEPEKSQADEVSMPDHDWQLQFLVNMSHLGDEVGVTLTTPAGLVTGIMIGGEKYLDLFSARYKLGMDEHRASDVDEIIAGWKQPYEEIREGAKNADYTAFIHLKDAKLLTSGSFVPTDGVLWRGRLDQVIGFSLGRLS